jgi:hypothetical protein
VWKISSSGTVGTWNEDIREGAGGEIEEVDKD